MNSPTSSFLTLTTSSLTFIITKAHIKESLESLWSIECEGYIESLKEHPFSQDSTNSSNLNFHPNALINQQASLKISNPYPKDSTTSKTLNFTSNTPSSHTLSSSLAKNNESNQESPYGSNRESTNQSNKESPNGDSDIKEYQGVLFCVEYLGLNAQSSANVLNRGNKTTSLNHKHFFTFTLRSSLYRIILILWMSVLILASLKLVI